MFNCEQDPLSLLIELTPKLAKKRYRQSIYDAWDHKCGYCGDEATSLDHIIPRFKSGSSNRNNLLPACRRCNSNKASMNVDDWYSQQQFYCPSRHTRIKAWMSQEPIEIFAYNVDTVLAKFAAG